MIPFEFEYYRPSTIMEAVQLFMRLDKEGKQPMYYSGGTEFITLGRLNFISAGAVIDIKNINECTTMEEDNDSLILGSALTLTAVNDANVFPLLTAAASEVADRTARNKITLGGNICGTIFYREAVLPFLLSDSEVIIAGPNGLRQVPIRQIFNQTIQLQHGEFLIQISTNKKMLELPYKSIKRRRQWYTGYPLATISAIRDGEYIKVAFSGVSPFPYRSNNIEEVLNEREVPLETRLDNAITLLEKPILNDTEGSSEYRKFVVKNTLQDILKALGGE